MKNQASSKKLKKDFYTRDLLLVAKELLGKILVKKENDNILSGFIVEVEAYDGDVDEAAHTFIGKTKRNEIMFEEGGYLYIYFTYGAHFCCNIVTGIKNRGTAVLIRAIEPLEGIGLMIKRRFLKNTLNEKEMYNLTSGPGKVCKAFNLNKEHYGLDLTADKVFILDQPVVEEDNIITTTRVGIKRSVNLPWRFYIKNNPYVSKK